MTIDDTQLAVLSDWLEEKNLRWVSTILKNRDLLYASATHYSVGDACCCREQLPHVAGYLEHHLPDCGFGELLLALGGEKERLRQEEGGRKIAEAVVGTPKPLQNHCYCGPPRFQEWDITGIIVCSACHYPVLRP